MQPKVGARPGLRLACACEKDDPPDTPVEFRQAPLTKLPLTSGFRYL
jgi:hypothetical protein